MLRNLHRLVLARRSPNPRLLLGADTRSAMSRRECLAAFATLGVVSGCKLSPTPQLLPSATRSSPPQPGKNGGGETPLKNFTPEEFGAAGDGVTNDTEAFARMTAAVNQIGGGTIILSKTTYIVGAQGPDPAMWWYAFAPAPIMNFAGCSRNLTILGNGARLRCADGLRYGTFDPVTGAPTQHPMPYTTPGESASPYIAMIDVENCTGKVEIRDLELDGNSQGLVIGGTFGDDGWQLPAGGLRLLNNSGGEHVYNVRTHHHGQDGLYLDNAPDRPRGTLIEKVVSEYNGRQGCSVVGGANYAFVDSKFNHTGRATLHSSPGAGVDIEAEVRPIRNLSFTGCEFSNNRGVGMIADSGDSADATFDNCSFIGTDAWAAWPMKPRFRFTDCVFVGSICMAYYDANNPDNAAQFRGCKFSDDPALSPTGQLTPVNHGFVADLGAGDNNVLFDDCLFDLKHSLLLPYTGRCTYNNCTMFQASDGMSYPRGTYTGTDKIDGNVNLMFSQVVGQLTVNGQLAPPTNSCGWPLCGPNA